jgi:putative transposase
MSSDTDTTQASWELPEAVWQRMEPLIPPRKSKEGRPQTVDLKRITEGIFYVLRTGIQWHACPRERFGRPSTVYYYFRPWVTAGVFGHWWAVALTVFDDLKGLEWTWQRVDGAMTTAPLGARPRAPIPRIMASAGRTAVC